MVGESKRQRIQRIEDAESVEIGRIYLVNTVQRKSDNKIFPIHGPLHEDKEIIGFPDRHWHIDWRFVAKGLYAALEEWSMGFSMPWEQPISFQNTTGIVKPRRMVCMRQFGEYAPIDRIHWFARLQEKYLDAKMRNLICPHKGIPCNATPTKDGVVVCRGHGLAFNIETGDLVYQSPQGRSLSNA